MAKVFNMLTLKDRRFIEKALRMGNSLEMIGEALKRSIYIEVRKNGGKHFYSAKQAQSRAETLLKVKLEKARANIKLRRENNG